MFWACPICRVPGSIRPHRRREACTSCGTRFWRGRGARIIAERDGGSRTDRTALEWLEGLGPVVAPVPDPTGHVLGPESVRVRIAKRQKPLTLGGELIGWMEVYDRAITGRMTLGLDGIHFLAGAAAPSGPGTGGPRQHWDPADLTAIQPASSSIQLGFHGQVASVKFLEGSVRLWTRAIMDVVDRHYRKQGLEVVEFQSTIRTRPVALATHPAPVEP